MQADIETHNAAISLRPQPPLGFCCGCKIGIAMQRAGNFFFFKCRRDRCRHRVVIGRLHCRPLCSDGVRDLPQRIVTETKLSTSE